MQARCDTEHHTRTEGQALLVNLPRRVVLHHFSFRAPVTAVSFSPNGRLGTQFSVSSAITCFRFIAAGVGRLVQVWRAPGQHKEFAPFVLHRELPKHSDDVTTLGWSPDSRYIASGSRDTTCLVHAVDPIPGFRVFRLMGHRGPIVRIFFAKNNLEARGPHACTARPRCTQIYSISQDGALFVWRGAQVPLKTQPSGMPMLFFRACRS